MGPRILRREHVVEITGLPTSTLYDEIAAGRFPRPVRITKRAVGWLETEVDKWPTARIAERDGEAA